MPNLEQDYRDRTSPVWDMSQERIFLEGVMNQRFNFFLVFFSLVLAGSINAKSQFQLQLVLYLGAVITSLLALVIWRAHRKLNTILGYLYEDPSHPVTLVDRHHRRVFSVRRLVGYVIPGLCTLTLWGGGILSSSHRLEATAATGEAQIARLRQDMDQFGVQLTTLTGRVSALERPIEGASVKNARPK